MKKQVSGERTRIFAQQVLEIPETRYQQRSLQASLSLFHSLERKKRLNQAQGVSASAMSRFFNVYNWNSDACWELLNETQWLVLLEAARYKRKPCLNLSVDLTTIEKVGEQIPFTRTYNGKYGIHLVVLFAQYEDIKFPVSYRIYRGKYTPTPVTLALEMLGQIPQNIMNRFRVRVLADSGFEDAAFLDGVRELDFEFIVGVRKNRRTDHSGHITVADCPHGGYIHLANWSSDAVSLGRFDRGDREFFAVSSEMLEGDEIIAKGSQRWSLESFFKEGKHQFGLAQFSLRTALGLDRWILMVFLAFTLTMLSKSEEMTLREAARLALYTFFPEAGLNQLLSLIYSEQEFLGLHGYSLVYMRCNL